MIIEISPKKVLIKLLQFISVLLILNIFTIISIYALGRGTAFGIVPFFNFNKETNIPTFYSSLTLLAASILLILIAMYHKRKKDAYVGWFGLGVIFSFLSIDEMTGLHERFIIPVQSLAGTTGGLLHYAWVIPYGIFLIILSILYFRFLLALPKKTRFLFILSAVIFVSGAIGFELFEGQLFFHEGRNVTYAVLYTFEELFEKIGVAVFIYALLSYIANNIQELKFRLGPHQKK